MEEICFESIRASAEQAGIEEETAASVQRTDFQPKYHRWLTARAANRKFIVTDTGYYGVAPPLTESGDVCISLPSAGAAFVLRNVDIPGRDKIIGEIHMIGIQGFITVAAGFATLISHKAQRPTLLRV